MTYDCFCLVWPAYLLFSPLLHLWSVIDVIISIHVSIIINKHTHAHTRLTALFPGLPGWAGTRKVKPIWILLKQLTVRDSGISWAIYKSASRSSQITMPVLHHSSFLQAGCPSCRPTNSVKALKAVLQCFDCLLCLLSTKLLRNFWHMFVCWFMYFSFKNGSLTRERIRNSCTNASWEDFSIMLDSTPRGNYGNIGILFCYVDCVFFV